MPFDRPERVTLRPATDDDAQPFRPATLVVDEGTDGTGYILVPAPPATGTAVLTSTDGVVSWEPGA